MSGDSLTTNHLSLTTIFHPWVQTDDVFSHVVEDPSSRGTLRKAQGDFRDGSQDHAIGRTRRE